MGDTMQVVCLDGTTIECGRFKAIDEGVLLFEDAAEDSDDDDEAESDEAIGFIPMGELRFVLPEEVEYEPTGGQQQPSQQQPPQQQMQQQPPQQQSQTPPQRQPSNPSPQQAQPQQPR